MDLRSCIVCGGEFPRSGKIVLCSDACKVARKRQYQEVHGQKYLKPKAQRECPRCGTAFVTGRTAKRHCSNKCKDAMRKGNKPPRRKGPALTKTEEHRRYKAKYPERVRAQQRAYDAKRVKPEPKTSPELKAARQERDRIKGVLRRIGALKRRAKRALTIKVVAAQPKVWKRGSAPSTLLLKANPDRYAKNLSAWRAKSLLRKTGVVMLDDLTVDGAVVFGGKRCLYCDCALDNDNRTIDHMTPLVNGGVHSAANIAPCCHTCNVRKGPKLFIEWIDRLAQPHRARAVRYFEKRNGPMQQMGLALAVA